MTMIFTIEYNAIYMPCGRKVKMHVTNCDDDGDDAKTMQKVSVIGQSKRHLG